MKATQGFTLIELLTTIAVAAVLLTLAIPSFRSTILNNRLTTVANEFITDVNIARSEAVKEGTTVTVTSNSGTNWAAGWTITDAGGTTLRVHGPLDSASSLTGSAATFKYQPSGFTSSAATLTFDVCDDRTGETGRRVTILTTGRPSVGDQVCS